MDGILVIDKPRGKTSFAVVAQIRRLTGERRVGHAGTLDPEATGVLPVCLGQATRVVAYLMDATKTYRAEIELGVATDTYDAGGKVTQRGDASGIERGQLEAALAPFRGRVEQTPPMFSAVKHRGQPLYQLARAGVTVERKSRQVEIHRLELTAWRAPVARVEVTCSKGTYIRSLAHDLGQRLGCGASLLSLVRLRHGVFCLEDAVSLPGLEEAFRRGDWQALVRPVDSVLSHWQAVTVDDEAVRAIRNGRPVELETVGETLPPEFASKDYCRAYATDGRLVALLRFSPDTGLWQPKKVFP